MKIRKSNRSDDGERAALVPSAKYENWEPAPLPPTAPDGGFDPRAVAVNVPDKLPAATPQNMICLRGPCRHYWYCETNFDAGNPGGTFESLGLAAPRQRHHLCTLIPGMETDFTEDVCFECNRWDPLDAKELAARQQRRAEYYRANPDHDPNNGTTT
jgi:hypothetical protein